MTVAQEAPPSAMELVSIRGVTAGYGALDVLTGVDLTVRAGEFLGVIGHNGAGKSTLLRVVSKLLVPRAGTVAVPARIGLVPQGLSVFPRMSVGDNLALPEITRRRGGELAPVEEVLEMFPVLGERLRQPAGNLSGGEQRMVAIGMALRLVPELLLLDEPSLGLAPMLVRQIMQTIDEHRQRHGYAVIIVEQNLDVLLRRADRLIAIRQGQIVWSGLASDVSDVRQLWEYF